jgi:hypothetical protein
LKEEGEPAQPIEQRLLPMQFKVGDRLVDETASTRSSVGRTPREPDKLRFVSSESTTPRSRSGAGACMSGSR